MTIDWTKPIETVPCERNPLPVPCEYVDGEGVRILGEWVDKDGSDEGGDGFEWSMDKDTGEFLYLDGFVRNVDPIKNAIELLTSKGYSVGEPDTLVADRGFLAGLMDKLECEGAAYELRHGDMDMVVPSAMAYLRANKERI